jgi:hypothetical protein
MHPFGPRPRILLGYASPETASRQAGHATTACLLSTDGLVHAPIQPVSAYSIENLTHTIMNELYESGGFRLLVKYSDQGGCIEDHFGRPLSS